MIGNTIHSLSLCVSQSSGDQVASPISQLVESKVHKPFNEPVMNQRPLPPYIIMENLSLMRHKLPNSIIQTELWWLTHPILPSGQLPGNKSRLFESINKLHKWWIFYFKASSQRETVSVHQHADRGGWLLLTINDPSLTTNNHHQSSINHHLRSWAKHQPQLQPSFSHHSPSINHLWTIYSTHGLLRQKPPHRSNQDHPGWSHLVRRAVAKGHIHIAHEGPLTTSCEEGIALVVEIVFAWSHLDGHPISG